MNELAVATDPPKPDSIKGVDNRPTIEPASNRSSHDGHRQTAAGREDGAATIALKHRPGLDDAGTKWVTLLVVAGIVFFVRLLTLGLYPLMDTTEARYGDIARIMVETDDWLTPRFDYDTPFWGKPPMHTWMSAASILLFGFGEFAVRFPHWLAGFATLLAIWIAAKRRWQGLSRPALAVAVLTSTAVFIISSGTVMTDMALCLAITLALVCFREAWLGNRNWQWGFFSGLGLGLFVKGPVMIAICAIAIIPWIVTTAGVANGLRIARRQLSWLPGLLLTAAISLPWYLLAERATPGFLEYFLVGEHWLRFTQSGWSGDLYGTAHSQPRGSIWLFWATACLPWSPVVILLLARRTLAERWSALTSWRLFLLFWMVSPLILFTLAGNILHAYVLPGVPALALLIADLARTPSRRAWVAGVAPWALLLVAATLYFASGRADGRSEKGLLDRGARRSIPIYYTSEVPFSAKFYSRGRARQLTTTSERPFYIVTEKLDSAIPPVDCSPRSDNDERVLYYCPERLSRLLEAPPGSE